MATVEERAETRYRDGKGAPRARSASGAEATTVTNPAETRARSYGDDHRAAIDRHKEEMKDMMRRHRDGHRAMVTRHEKELAAIGAGTGGSREANRRYSRGPGR